MIHLNAKGYEYEYDPGHPLASVTGTVLVHRRVLYDVLGPDDAECHWCGKRLSWWLPNGHPDRLESDHLSGDKRANSPSNLVPADRVCNVRRQHAGNPVLWDSRVVSTCSVPHCERPREKQKRGSNTLCAAHRWRLKHHGDVMANIPIRQSRTALTQTGALA